MTALNFLPYYCHLVESGKMTAEEANKKLAEIIKADIMADRFDREIRIKIKNDRPRNFAYDYWEKSELGRKMLASELISDSDLLFLIPNNVKKMHGVPMTRIACRNKSKAKANRRRHILSFELFQIISDVISELIPNNCDNEFFNEFVDFKNVHCSPNDNISFEENNK